MRRVVLKMYQKELSVINLLGMRKSLFVNWIHYIAPKKPQPLCENWNEKGKWRKKKELRPQANNAQYNTQWENGGGVGVKWEDSGEGGGAGGSFTQTYIWAGWNSMTMHINFSILLKRDFYLLRFKSEGQQKPGDVSLMQSDYKWLHWMLL
jgi:hypothetical protein